MTGYTDTAVSNGTTYYYQVAAVNAVGSGPGSNERSATPTGLVPVTRLGGAASNFASASSSAGSMSFSLPAGTDRLVAMISVYTTSTTVTSMTWKPDPGNPSLDQPLTSRRPPDRVGQRGGRDLGAGRPDAGGRRRGAEPHPERRLPSGCWACMPWPGWAATGPRSAPAPTAPASRSTCRRSPAPWCSTSSSAPTAPPPTAPVPARPSSWDTNTSGGTKNLRGAGSAEAGAATTTMSWTSGAATHHALLAVSYNPATPTEPPAPTAPGAPQPDRRATPATPAWR